VTSTPRAPQPDREVRAWQEQTWDLASKVYVEGVEPRFTAIVDGMMRRAGIRPGECVADLGCGTGPLTLRAAAAVAPSGRVEAVDISEEMLRVARARVGHAGLTHVTFHRAGAEALPLAERSVDVVLAGMSLMFVPDRAAAAREIARVLRPGGRLVATFPTGPETCDLVKFQRILGSFAPEPPAKGIGPGALADPTPFVRSLKENGIEAIVEQEEVGFGFANLEEAWSIFAVVTAMRIPPEQRESARQDVQRKMWPGGNDGPCRFRNVIQFLAGTRA
jgi:SAM-dependent methyltransferase